MDEWGKDARDAILARLGAQFGRGGGGMEAARARVRARLRRPEAAVRPGPAPNSASCRAMSASSPGRRAPATSN